ncbi:hypothetical protein OV090_12225 [Nannocystis sp. RBIL2]|uniref:hypothetical protein n=1 Tax=Nannocystis sp. RBIL2 TaxID=2996788 RepID=UPI00226D4EED|nr:hypothetical protein [Nannocystis sp. RBIL2]MCY1065537.1 hypothetical protein [Nannocystis sp. RBIL2]
MHSRELLRAPAPEPATSRLFRASEVLFVDLAAGPLRTPRGIWRPGTGADALFTETFALVDDQAYWAQPEPGAALLRIPRDLDHRWIRDDFPCRGWLLGERDDSLWCAEVHDDRIDVTVLDKSGFGAPAPAATLPWPESLGSSLHPRLDGQGPLLVGDRVVLPALSGFVSAELEGNGVVEAIELGHRPSCVVARGERLAWRAHPDGALYSGELPLAAIRHEHAGEGLLGCPAWAGDSLLFRARGEALELLRSTADGRLFSLAAVPPALDVLVSDSERAFWLVRGRGLWWIDATNHGRVESPDIAAYAVTADDGLLLWRTVDDGMRSIVVGDVFGAGDD